MILDPKKAAKYKGKITVYDDPIYIADAAVYLKTHQPDLGIENPYELDEEQFNAAVDLLKQQQPNVGEYWSTRRSRSSVTQTGMTWSARPGSTSTSRCWLKASRWQRARRTGVRPRGGRDRVVRHLDDRSEAKHPNCMYKWMNYVDLARSQRPRSRSGSVRRRRRARPASLTIVGDRKDGFPGPKFCDNTTQTIPEFWKRVYYWNTPVADCGDRRAATRVAR